MSHLSRRLSVTLLLAGITIPCNAGEMRKVWELRFSELAGSGITNPTAFVSALSFSPDGSHLAANVWGNQVKGGEGHFLIIVDLNNPRVGVRSFKIEGPEASEDSDSPAAISWSPRGDMIAVPTVVQLSGGTECVLTNTLRAVFYDADPVADNQAGFPKSTIRFFDSTCEPMGAWEIDGKWRLSDASADRHLLAMSNDIPRQTRVIVADPARKIVVHSWTLQDVEGSWPLFADRGKAVCALDGSGKHGVAHCWDVESGAEIAKTNAGNPHWPMKAALHAKRVILSDYGWKVYAEGLEIETGSLKRRVVWDFGTGKDLASWKPQVQSPMSRSAGAKEPYKFAISPSGDNVAEGGNGDLIFYRIDP